MFLPQKVSWVQHSGYPEGKLLAHQAVRQQALSPQDAQSDPERNYYRLNNISFISALQSSIIHQILSFVQAGSKEIYFPTNLGLCEFLGVYHLLLVLPNVVPFLETVTNLSQF